MRSHIVPIPRYLPHARRARVRRVYRDKIIIEKCVRVWYTCTRTYDVFGGREKNTERAPVVRCAHATLQFLLCSGYVILIIFGIHNILYCVWILVHRDGSVYVDYSGVLLAYEYGIHYITYAVRYTTQGAYGFLLHGTPVAGRSICVRAYRQNKDFGEKDAPPREFYSLHVHVKR